MTNDTEGALRCAYAPYNYQPEQLLACFSSQAVVQLEALAFACDPCLSVSIRGFFFSHCSASHEKISLALVVLAAACASAVDSIPPFPRGFGIVEDSGESGHVRRVEPDHPGANRLGGRLLSDNNLEAGQAEENHPTQALSVQQVHESALVRREKGGRWVGVEGRR